MRFAEIGIKLQSFFSFRFDPRLARARRVEPVISPGECRGKSRMGEGERRIVLDRFAIELLGYFVILEQTVRALFVSARLEIDHISVRILGRLGFHAVFFRRAERGAQLTRDFLGQLALKTEGISQWPVVTFSPEMMIVARVDQLHAHDHAVLTPAHTAFEHVHDSEGQRDLRQITFRGAAIRHYRGAADDLQVVDLGETSQDVVLNSIGEKGVLLVIAHVFEGEHGDAFFRHGGSRLGGSAAIPLENEERDQAKQHADNQEIESAAGMVRDGFLRGHLFGSLDALWSQLVSPRENHGDGKTEQKENNHQPHAPARDFKKWKYLGRDLDEQPGGDAVGDGDLVDVSSLEFGEKISEVHALAPD